MDRDKISEIVRRVVADMMSGQPVGTPTNGDVARGYIPVGISNRHVHLSKEHMETLFGKGSQLTHSRPLLQKGEFAARETVTLIGPRMKALEGVRILGPARDKTQVEISLTDAYFLGIRPPVRPSGEHEGTPGILIVGPMGFVNLESGVIRANRHVHISTEDARSLKLTDNDRVLVRVEGDRPLIYYDVQVRVRDSFVAEMHLDTDDANASGLRNGDRVKILLTDEECRICHLPGKR